MAQIFFFNDYWVVIEQGGPGCIYKANPCNDLFFLFFYQSQQSEDGEC